MGSIVTRVRMRLFVAAYSIEEARQRAADRGHLWTQAAACIALALLRKLGG